MFGPENPRYVSEWDYYKADRDRDFADFYAEVEPAHIDELMLMENDIGTEYRDTVIINESLSLLSVTPYRDRVHSGRSYIFAVSWKNVAFDGHVRPQHDGSVQPFLEMTITSKYKQDRLVIENLPYDEYDDFCEYIADQFGAPVDLRSVTSFIVGFLEEFTYDLDRELQEWGYSLADMSQPNVGGYDLGG